MFQVLKWRIEIISLGQPVISRDKELIPPLAVVVTRWATSTLFNGISVGPSKLLFPLPETPRSPGPLGYGPNRYE